MRFAVPEMLWLFWLLPLVWFAFWVAKRQATRRLARFARVERLYELAPPPGASRGRVRAAARLLALSCVILALGRPQWGASEMEVEQAGIELIIALDISRSMMAQDVKPDRLTRAKGGISELVESLHGDRVGLVFFAGGAFAQCPLTTDYGAIRLFLSQADPSMIGSQGTDLAVALNTCLELFGEDDGSTHRVILLVTDGEDFGEGIEAISEGLRRADITMYAIGMGTTEGAPIPDFNDAGVREGFVRDREGNVAISRLDEAPLIQLSRATEGVYVRAGSRGIDIERLGAELDALEDTKYAAKRITSYQERAIFPMLLAMVLLLGELALRDRGRVLA
jgi:Ca-activated chloride channel family protein